MGALQTFDQGVLSSDYLTKRLSESQTPIPGFYSIRTR
jgi:hypothetical protein